MAHFFYFYFFNIWCNIVPAGLSCIIAGWGTKKVERQPKGNDEEISSDVLQMLPLQIMDTNDCKKHYQTYPELLPEGSICTKALLNRAAFTVHFLSNYINLKIQNHPHFFIQLFQRVILKLFYFWFIEIGLNCKRWF